MSYSRVTRATASDLTPAREVAVYGRLLLVVLLFCFAFAGPAPAQVTTAEVMGTAMDTSGSVVPGVRVTLKNKATGEEFVATSDPGGSYSFRLLPIGHYLMQAELQGFKKWSSSDVALAVGDRLRQDLRLEIGLVEQTVEVVASTPALQTDSSSLGTLTEERAVQNLPLNGRNFVVLVQLAAGSAGEGNTSLSMASGARPDDRRRSSSVTVNAYEPAYNNYQIDGMDNNEAYTGTVVVKPSIDALAEVKVQTLLLPAEMGRTSAGSINLLTKSGANELHGTLFEFFRNEKMDARNYFATTGPKPNYKQNQFGGSLGGAIRKSRSFFFADYEGFRLRQGQTTVSTVPTVAQRSGNFAGMATIFDPSTTRVDSNNSAGYIRSPFAGNQIPLAQIDVAGQNAVNLYPLPITSALANNYTLSPNKKQRDDTMDVRLDHRIGERDNIYGRYSFNDTNTYTPSAFLAAANGISPVGDVSFSGPSYQRSQGAQITEIHSFTPKLVGEFKAGFTRLAIQSLPPNTGNNASQQIGIKGINYDWDSSGLSIINPSGYRMLGDQQYLPLITISNLFQEVANLMYASGAHSFKFGVDLRRRQSTPFQSNSPRGIFAFDSNFTNDPSGAVAGSGNSIASLLLGYPSSTTRNKTLSWNGYRAIEFGSYIQDDWRVNRWLTINIGLRYDYFSPLTEVNNRISNVDFALGKIVIAGQNGVSASAGVEKDWLNLGPRFGFAAKLSEKLVLRGGYAIMFMPPAWQSAHTFRNPPFTSLYTVTATPITPINRLSDGLPLPLATDPANPTGTLAPVTNDLQSPYSQQFSLGLQREFLSSFVATASYVGSLGRKLTPSVGGTVNLDIPGPGAGSIQPRRPYYAMFPNVSGINLMGNWVNSSYQALQTTLERRFKNSVGFVANYTWAHGIDNLAYYYATGPKAIRGNAYSDIRHRFTLTSNIDLPFGKNTNGVAGALVRNWGVNIVADIATGLPFDVTNAAARANNGSTDRPNLVGDPILPSDQRTVTRWFNTAAFASQALYTYGNLGRYALYGPGKFKLDFSAHREFGLTEKLKLQMRGEAFNITNTPAFGAPGASFGSSSFGVISSAGLARNVQLALKLLF